MTTACMDKTKIYILRHSPKIGGFSSKLNCGFSIKKIKTYSCLQTLKNSLLNYLDFAQAHF